MARNPLSASSASSSSNVDQFPDDYAEDDVVRADYFESIKNGDMNTYEKLLGHPAIDVGLVNARGQTPLHVAVESGNRTVARERMTLFDNALDAFDHHGYSAIMYATRHGLIDMVADLIAAKASVNQSLNQQQSARAAGDAQNADTQSSVASALHLAVERRVLHAASGNYHPNDKAVENLLIDAGADPSDALLRAVFMGQSKIARVLIRELGATPTRAFDVAVKEKHLDNKSAGVLLYLGADKAALIAAAAERGDTDYVRRASWRIHPMDNEIGMTASHGNIAATRLLLKVATQPDRAIFNPHPGQAPLDYAAQHGDTSTASVLIAAGVDASESLASLSRRGLTAQAKVLIDAGADAPAVLQSLAKDGAVHAVRTLLDAKADLAHTEFISLSEGGDKKAVSVLTDAIAASASKVAQPVRMSKGVLDKKRDLARLDVMLQKGETTAAAILKAFPNLLDSHLLDHLVQNNHLAIAKSLVPLLYRKGEDSLGTAIRTDKLDLVKGLLSVGVNGASLLLNVMDTDVPGDYVKVARTLIVLGVNPSQALMLAVEQGNKTARAFLPFLGAELPGALAHAAETGNVKAAQALMLEGADITEALDQTQQRGLTDASNLLMNLNKNKFAIMLSTASGYNTGSNAL